MGRHEFKKWTLAEFFAWQEQQHERFELAGGLPVRMMSGTKAVHDAIVTNIIGELRTQLRGKSCRPFSGEHSVETLPGQIRRPDAGVDCGPFDPEAYKAGAPRVIFEVLSPTTRDFDIFAKLEEYKTVQTVQRIIFVDTIVHEATVWSRQASGGWELRVLQGLENHIEIPEIGVNLAFAEIYDRVSFSPDLRLVRPA